jgi:hypothetical protein
VTGGKKASVPRGTADVRVAARVPPDKKLAVRGLTANLTARGLRATESDLVHMLLDEALTGGRDGGPDLEDLDRRLRRWRGRRGADLHA